MPIVVGFAQFRKQVLEKELESIQGVLGLNACKLIPSFFVKQLSFNEELRSGEDVVFYARLFTGFLPVVKVVPLEENAIYYRTKSDNSVSRQPLSLDFNIRDRLSVIRALASIKEEVTDKKRAALVHSRETAQAMFIVSYLNHFPEHHSQFVEMAREALEDPQWLLRWVNGKLARRLVVSYCFPPYVDPAGIVAAKRIQAASKPVDVIYNQMKDVRDSNPRLEGIVDEFLGDSIELKTSTSFGNWKAIEAFADEAAEAAGGREAAKGSYESVYSRALWPASNYAAALIKVKNPKIHWAAEFSDPILLDIHGTARHGKLRRSWLSNSGILDAVRSRGLKVPDTDNLFAWCEFLPYFLADELIFTNSHQLTYMMSYLDDLDLAESIQSRAVIQAQPTLPGKFYSMGTPSYRVDDSHTNIGYFGSFYATRGLDDVLEAVRLLPNRERKKIRLHIFTNQGEIVKSKEKFSEIEEHLVLNSYVDFFDFLALTRVFDCLLVNDASTIGSKPVNPYLPSKVSDYLGSGTPIWGICEPGSILDGLRAQGKLAYSSRIGDLQSQIDTLSLLARSGSTSLQGDSSNKNNEPEVVVDCSEVPGVEALGGAKDSALSTMAQ